MRVVMRASVAVLILALGATPTPAEVRAGSTTAAPAEEAGPPEGLGKEDLARLAAAIIAASVAAYLATGRPCACPYSTMRNGRVCGEQSAYAKPGGLKPLCFPAAVTFDMIPAYRANGAIPSIK